ncbi:MAG TPA: hypothetical protein VFG64_13440 [Dongiaceae bacterium]|nr:hypothetical protein [Dongiaceae bacterium]
MATRIAQGTRRVPGASFGASALLRVAVASFLCLALLIQPALAAGGSGHGNGSSNGNGNSGGGNNAGGNGNAGGNSNAGGNGKSNAGGNGKSSNAHGAVNDAASEVEDPNSALGLREAGRIHPLADAYSAAERQFGGKVIDAVLALRDSKTWTYDLRLVTQDGRVRTLSYDATTLALLTIDGAPAE